MIEAQSAQVSAIRRNSAQSAQFSAIGAIQCILSGILKTRRHSALYSALPGATRRYPALPGATRRYPALLGPTRRYSALLGATRRYSALLGATRRYPALLGATRRYPPITLRSRAFPSQWELSPELVDQLLEHFVDPVHGSPSKGRKTVGVMSLHVDDLIISGTEKFLTWFLKKIREHFTVGHEDKNDLTFTGQRVCWVNDAQGNKKYISIDQKLCVSELEEIVIPKHLKDGDACDKALHTSYRSLLGSINWLQSRTQFQACYQFSRLASASAAPTVAHCKELNKLCRQIRGETVELRVWPVKGSPRILGIPDAAFRNNSDKSSQRAMTIFIADERVKNRRDTRGSLVFFESTKIKRTTLSTTVAELYALMKCFGTCQMLRGLWKDISGLDAEIHIRTDANNLVSTASTTHSPEQQETIHMIQMLRKEACSGAIADLSHVRTEHCLSDCLTKRSANPRNLLNSVQTGWLKEIDSHPPFRSMIEHKAFMNSWLLKEFPVLASVQHVMFMQERL